ncbi:Scr1 family TA system antitoxin-like transcriptional regulator [Micromonospora sp. 4G55]|uniref:Scr1 family TA system antitoxin-like transcriptional regulator n=1 Tax=Micromonospora sp. 4G55 TaxID=2806102 RepID=UPI001EE4339D
MPPAVPSPILRRRRLGTELRRLREAAGLTGDQVIERIGWASASKLSRLENGRSRPDPDDVRLLLDLYGAEPELRDDLIGITHEAGDMRGWRKSYPVMTQQQLGWAEIEAGCAEIREYNPVLVPGLLQTPGYARLRIVSADQAPARPATPRPARTRRLRYAPGSPASRCWTGSTARATRRCWRRPRWAAGPGRRRCCTSSW